MGKRTGRPRLTGKRTKSGRLIPLDPEARRVKGSEQAERRKELFGDNGYDPLGRAYAVGLLGEGQEAKDRIDAGRGYVSLHRAVWGHRGYRCALDTSPRGGAEAPDSPQAAQRREKLYRLDQRIEATHAASFFLQLVNPSGSFADEGPRWLDDLVVAALENRKRTAAGKPQVILERTELRADLAVLKMALRGLDALVSQAPFRATGDRAEGQRMAA